MSRQDLAERSGLTVGAITQVETGRRRPSFETFVALARGLEVSLDFLAGLKEKPDLSDLILDKNVREATETLLGLPPAKRRQVAEFIAFLHASSQKKQR